MCVCLFLFFLCQELYQFEGLVVGQGQMTECVYQSYQHCVRLWGSEPLGQHCFVIESAGLKIARYFPVKKAD